MEKIPPTYPGGISNTRHVGVHRRGHSSKMVARIDCRAALFYQSHLVGKVIVFCATFLSFAAHHAVRKGFSNVKVNIAAPYCDTEKYITCSQEINGNIVDYCCNNQKEKLCLLSTDLTAGETSYSNLTLCDAWFGGQDETTTALGLLDTLFLFFYAAGLFVAGILRNASICGVQLLLE